MVNTFQRSFILLKDRSFVERPIGAPESVSRCEKVSSSSLDRNKISADTISFVHNLMTSDWRPCDSHPPKSLTGHFVVFKWCPREKTWVVIFVGSGHVSCDSLHLLTTACLAQSYGFVTYIIMFHRKI